jgi:hypothetical protein
MSLRSAEPRMKISQRLACSMWSRWNWRASMRFVSRSMRLATVSLRHCDIDAVLRPRPNFARSSLS